MTQGDDRPPDDTGGDPTDFDDLARRYLDFWQDHLATLAGDEQVVAQVARTLELINAGAAAFASEAQKGMMAMSDAMTGRAHGQERPDDPAGPAAPAAAPGPHDPDLADCARRLADLEERVRALESRRERDQ